MKKNFYAVVVEFGGTVLTLRKLLKSDHSLFRYEGWGF